MNMKSEYILHKNFTPVKIWTSILCCMLLITLSSCEKHDFLDENAITGNVGPQAYWEVGSTTVSASSNVPFIAQYYSTVADINHSEVWYSITEIQEKSVSCSWVTTFNYSINSIKTEHKRISQKINEYPHTLSVWSDSLHAYTFTADFPVSGTLKPFAWVKPDVFDSTKMVTYFGQDFMQHFKDSLYNLMKFADFKNMMLGLSLMENFKQFTDSSFDINSNSYIYHFPKDTQGNTPVPDAIREIYDDIKFKQLISGASGYNVEYKRNYYIEAILRVYDSNNIYGTTVLKRIDIN